MEGREGEEEEQQIGVEVESGSVGDGPILNFKK